MRQNSLNVSETAASLHTSQPAVSKQIRAFKDEIGTEFFELSGRQITHIGMRRHRDLRPLMYDFIEQFAPHLTRDLVSAALASPSAQARHRLFEKVVLPDY